MNEKELREAAELYRAWSVEQLVRATTAERRDYEPEALELMARELSRRGVSASDRESVEKTVLQEVEDERGHLTGIRGFLLLFVIMVFVSSLVYAWLGLAFLGAGGIFLLGGVLSLVLSGYGFFVFYLLIRKLATAPQHAKRLLIIGVALHVLAVLAAWVATGQFDRGALSQVTIPLIWLGYLNWSRRVANTYAQARPQPVSRDEQSTDVA